MKNTFLILLTVSLLVVLAACNGETTETDYSPLEISRMIVNSQDQPPNLYTIVMEEEEFADYVTTFYHLSEEMLEDGAISYGEGAEATEFAVLHLKDGVDPNPVAELLLDYIETRTGDFFGYMPEQVFLLEQAVVEVSGNYVALLICENPQSAKTAFTGCFGEHEGPSSGEVRSDATSFSVMAMQPADSESGNISTDAILQAWRTGDRTGLSDKNLRVLDACAAVIGERITDPMTDYQKELTIHDWMIQWAEYDVETKSRSPNASPHPDNDNPYGLVIGKRAICTGYTVTFQLFMDMLDIECLTVPGRARDGESEHAWNMVRLDGQWYCVDVTWNDPVGLKEYNEEIQHMYFNVTSDYLRESGHQWDESFFPEASATEYAWNPAE